MKENNTMRPNYDFSKGIRGKYVKKIAAGTNIVVLERDVAQAFPNSEAVNKALRALLSALPTKVRARPSKNSRVARRK